MTGVIWNEDTMPLGLVGSPTPRTPQPWTERDEAEYQHAAAEDRAEALRVAQEEEREALVRYGSDGQRVQYEDADDASEHLLRMAEGWC